MTLRPVALVTGASRGIGALIARGLAGAGYDLTVVARSADSVEALAEELAGAYGVEVSPVAADLSVEEEVRALARAHEGAHGRADLLVLNAGMGAIGPYAGYPLSRLDKMYAVNFRSAYVLGQELMDLLRTAGRTQERGGKIIAIASTTGLVGEPLNSAYGATKAALISWCETVTTEEFSSGVTATAVCPGYVATDMTKNLDGDVLWGEMLPPDDVAQIVVALSGLSKRTAIPRIAMTRPGSHLWRA